MDFLTGKGITSVDGLRDYVSEVSDRHYEMTHSCQKKSERMRELKTMQGLARDYSILKPVVDGIPAKNGFGKKREKYLAEHDSEIRQFYAVRRKLDQLVPDKKLKPKAWQDELDRLKQEHAAERAKVKALGEDLKSCGPFSGRWIPFCLVRNIASRKSINRNDNRYGRSQIDSCHLATNYELEELHGKRNRLFFQ